MIAPSDMILFAAVVREGSFTRAGSRLGITKQSVSERISRLEAALGVRLLERTTRQLRVTNLGATYYERCAAIAEQVDAANREVQQREGEPVGLLRVTSPSLFARRFLGPVLARFAVEHPASRVELVLADRRVDLVEEGFDLAIHLGPLEESSLVARRLGDAAMRYVASPSYLRRHGRPKSAREARCIGLGPFETWNVGGVKTRVEPVLMVNDYELACDAAIAGVGVARVPALVARAAIRAGRLKRLFDGEPAPRRPVSVLYPSRAYLPAKVRVFIDFLEAALRDGPDGLEPAGAA